MKENYFCKMKRLLLLAVFMMLPSLWQYAGAQVTLQAVDAGFTDGKWWIDLKNPGSTDLSGNGGENDKLGICFYIEKSGEQTTADNATTMRWNDEKTWTIPAGKTVRFTETGGRDNNMDGLTEGTTYYLNIKIQDNSALDNKVSVSWANATFKYQGKQQNGIYQISDFKKVSGFVVEAGTGTVLEAGKIYSLEKGAVYKFKNGKTVTELWRDAKGSDDKIFTFGWFDTKGTFLGVSGNYEIKNPGRAGYNGNYYDIIPVADQGATEVQDRYEHLRYNENGKELDFTNGALYLGGSKKGFGIPEANGTYGWDAGDTSANAEIKGSAIPQIGAGKYQFDISTGSQVKAWGGEGEPLLFKIYHYKRWSLPMGDSKDTFTNFEFKHKSGNETFQYDSKTYNQTFYHVEKDTEASPLGGMFEVTRSADPALGNGNIHGIAIGQDSDLPKFPNGYTFRFNLDLTQNAWDFPLQVSLKQRPYDSDVDGTDTWHAGDFTTKTGNVGEIKVCLNNNKKEKRISLRDALRLDWNIPYANSNPYDAENAVKIDKITVTGNMSVDDLYYLGDLVSAGKIAKIDLSEASVEGNQIPAGFASMKDDETLKEIILPSGLKTIGAEAFKGCKALETVTFSSGDKVMIGSGAFMNCTTLNNVQIQNIIDHADAVIASDTFNGTNAENITLANDITYIGKQAFANTNLKRLTLPEKCTGKEVKVEPYENWVMPGAIGSVFVGTCYNDGTLDIDAARTARTLTGTVTEISIEAEDFNQGYGVGWFNNGDHDDRSKANPVTTYHIDITDTQKGFGIFALTPAPGYKLGYMGLDYWFNYSFRVMDEGEYILSAYMATGKGQTVTPSFSIDGGEKVATTVKDGNWNPTQEYNVGSVHLTPGIHYVTFHGVKDSDIDKLVLKKGTDTGLLVITPGQNHGRVVTEYKFTHTTNPVSILSSDKDAFSGVNANNCEVVFPDGTTNDMVSGYRDGDNNAGILGLLTKTVSEDDPYDVVYQEHADVKATRTFNKKKWNSVVFPFTVNGKILKNATSEDGTLVEPFARAAYLFDNGFGTPGYDVKLRFVYLDNKNTFDENGKEEIKAGTPFLLFVDDTKDAPEGNVYVFKDITTPAASATVGLGYSGDKVMRQVDPAGEKHITDYSFEGRLDYKAGGDAFTNKIYWVADSKYYWGTNVTMKNMRSWFEPKTEAGARAIESLFGFVGDDATGISIVEANGGGNVNGGIYSLCGRLISTDPASLPRLPKGVYIVNGNKVIVK